jgi:DNA-binding response OmpR family regulator
MGVILVVDDDADLRELLAELLTKEGYQVLTASNGKEALALLRDPDPTPSLILLDLMMPVMSGWEFLERVASDRTVTSVPIIVMSAYLSVSRMLENVGIPPNLRIQKPFEPRVLLDLVAANCSEESPS